MEPLHIRPGWRDLPDGVEARAASVPPPLHPGSSPSEGYGNHASIPSVIHQNQFSLQRNCSSWFIVEPQGRSGFTFIKHRHTECMLQRLVSLFHPASWSLSLFLLSHEKSSKLKIKTNINTHTRVRTHTHTHTHRGGGRERERPFVEVAM
jgi:hypothetical protein